MMIESNDRFGKYALLERLAVGGMAEIYKAKTQGVDGFEKILAIKRLHKRLCEDRDFTVMLVDEAKLAVQLNHANIGQVFDLGFIDSQYFIVMEYIDGIDLHQLLRTLRKGGRRISVEAAIYIVSQACEALHYAHTKLGPDRKPLEIVHRDVSPQNVMLSLEGEIKLVDFGIAKARMRAQQTQAGIIKGKFYYMSPEQAYGHRVDARTDVYAMGLVLYEMIAGQNPYEEYDDSELLKRVRQGDFAPLGEVVTDVDPDLIKIVDMAVQRNSEYRYQSALELQRALMTFAAQKCPPFSRVEMAEYVRRMMGGGDPGVTTDKLDSLPMKRQDYSASEASIIYDSSALTTDEHDEFDEEERTQIYDRSGEGELLGEDFGEGEATSMLDMDSLPPLVKVDDSPFMQETKEEPELVASALRAAHVLGGAQVRDTQPQVNLSEGGKGMDWQALIASRRVQIGAIGVFSGLAVVLLVMIFALLIGGDGDDPDAEAALAAQASTGPTTLHVATAPPGARVSLDGRLIGISPIELDELEIGHSYELLLQLADYSEMKVEIRAQQDMEPLIVRLEPLQGVLKISSYPVGAKVRINGENYGMSPVTAVGIPRDGTHRIEAELGDGRIAEELIEWEKGDDRVKEIQLTFEDEDEEDDDEVEVAGTSSSRSGRKSSSRPKKTTPRSGSSRKASSGGGSLGAGAPIGRTVERKDDSASSKSTEPLNIWDIGAKKETGRLNVRVSEGGEGRVYINNQNINRAIPLVNYELDVGTHSVRVYFPTLKRSSDTKRVTIRANETATVVFSP
ncbi:MAG: protein kinase domain-containing protein [Bradymonadaceae bacterium]